MGNERVCQNLFQSGALQWVQHKDDLYDVLCIVTDENVVREGVVVLPDFLIRGLHIGSLEGGLADEHRVHYHS